MRSHFARLVVLTLSVFSVPGIGFGGPTPEPSDTAPDFVSHDLEGAEVRLADFAGKVVLLDFWATWCGPCLESFPHTQELATRFGDQGVVVLAVCTSDSRAKFEAWVTENQSKYPAVRFTHDPAERGDDRVSAKLYGVSGIPAQFVISRERRIVGSVVGYLGAADVRAEAALARAGLEVAPAVVAKGEDQARVVAEEEAARIAAEEANPIPSFVPSLGERKSGDPLPDLSLVGADGREFTLASLRESTVVIGIGFEDIVPIAALRAVDAQYSQRGVLALAMMIYSGREAYDTWRRQNADLGGVRSGWDPAGSYAGDREKLDMKAFEAWDASTALRKLMGGSPMNGTPGFPFFVVVDPSGRFVGRCHGGKTFDEGLGNLLLRAGVKLTEGEMPRKVATAEDFVVAPPAPPERPVSRIEIGAAAPEFAMTDLAGKSVKLADYAGKVVVLDFWATWCGPCVASMPHTQQVAADYKGQGVVVIGSCTSDGRKAFESWVRKNGPKYPDFVFAHDPLEKSPDRASRKLYGVTGIPAQFVVDRTGKIVAFVSGYREGEVLLEAALAKAGVAVDPAILAKAEEDQRKRDEN